MVTFYVIRHGETEANRNGILQGHLDVPLSEKGRRQAQIVAGALSRVRFDSVYSSDLSRAKETAQAIMDGRSCSLVLDRRLREIDLGMLSGLTSEEAHKRFPLYREQMRKDPYNVRRPGGESRADLRERVSRALDDVYEWNMDKKDAQVCLVSHGGVINAMFSIVSSQSEWPAFSVANCSVTVLRRDDKGWRIAKTNDCSHLDDAYLPPDPGA